MAEKTEEVINVEVALMGKDVKALKLLKGATVQKALVAAGMTSDMLAKASNDITVNSGVLPLGTPLKEGDFVTYTPRVEGGV